MKDIKEENNAMTAPQLLTISEGLYRHSTLREQENVPRFDSPEEFDFQKFFVAGERVRPHYLVPLGPTICFPEFRFSYCTQLEGSRLSAAEISREWMRDAFYEAVSFMAESADRLGKRSGAHYAAIAAHLFDSMPAVPLNHPAKNLSDEEPCLAEKLAALKEAHAAARAETCTSHWVMHPTVQLYVQR